MEYDVLYIVLRALSLLIEIDLIFITTLQGSCYCYIQFMDKKTENVLFDTFDFSLICSFMEGLTFGDPLNNPAGIEKATFLELIVFHTRVYGTTLGKCELTIWALL